MRQFTARDSGIDYTLDFDLSLNTLGCVMLDVELINSQFIKDYTESIGLEPYVSDDPEQFWIKGISDPEDLHITLRYGLLPIVAMSHCKKVLVTNDLAHPPNDFYPLNFRLTTFPGFNGEYFVLVLALQRDSINGTELDWYIRHVYEALGVLPNLSTFSPPTFHITLGYFKGEAPDFANMPVFVTLMGKGIRYGKHMRP